jgi:ribosomal protein L37AE/L43A
VYYYYFISQFIVMDESAKPRLVRCPKCQNVLHEQASYSVYQCGGCGTVLRGTLFLFIILSL